MTPPERVIESDGVERVYQKTSPSGWSLMSVVIKDFDAAVSVRKRDIQWFLTENFDWMNEDRGEL